MQNACPADIKMLKHITHVDQDDPDSKFKYEEPDADFEEYEAQSGIKQKGINFLRN